MRRQQSAGHRNTEVENEECQRLRKTRNDENEADECEFRDSLHSVRNQPEDVHTSARSEDWNDAATAVTSEFDYSDFDISVPSTSSFFCARYSGHIAAMVTGFISLISPILMVIIPEAAIAEWHIGSCGGRCQALLVGLAVRLLLLIIASCVLFLRSPRSTMPRVFVFRAVVVFLLFVIVVTFWLFYVFRVLGNHLVHVDQLSDDEGNELFYEDIVGFAASFADVLVFVHYLGIVLIELRHLDETFAVKVTRSPDGATQTYSVGRLSIQRLAVWCLQQYYRDFEASCCFGHFQMLVILEYHDRNDALVGKACASVHAI